MITLLLLLLLAPFIILLASFFVFFSIVIFIPLIFLVLIFVFFFSFMNRENFIHSGPYIVSYSINYADDAEYGDIFYPTNFFQNKPNFIIIKPAKSGLYFDLCTELASYGYPVIITSEDPKKDSKKTLARIQWAQTRLRDNFSLSNLYIIVGLDSAAPTSFSAFKQLSHNDSMAFINLTSIKNPSLPIAKNILSLHPRGKLDDQGFFRKHYWFGKYQNPALTKNVKQIVSWVETQK